MREAFKAKFEGGSQVYLLQTEPILVIQKVLSPIELPDVCLRWGEEKRAKQPNGPLFHKKQHIWQ